MKNRRRPRLLIYADSRARDLGRSGARYGIRSYVFRLQRKYLVDFVVQPHSHTTILDFLNYVETTDVSCYAWVVMHCGIVDFSPRPLSNIEKIREAKVGLAGYADLFERNASYHEAPWPILYNGEPTITLYSETFLREELIPRLQRVQNLVWITSNRFVPGWEGNYTKGRPTNIGLIVAEFDNILKPALARVVDLYQWGEDDVRRYTIDNLHFSPPGFQRVTELLLDSMAS